MSQIRQLGLDYSVAQPERLLMITHEQPSFRNSMCCSVKKAGGGILPMNGFHFLDAVAKNGIVRTNDP